MEAIITTCILWGVGLLMFILADSQNSTRGLVTLLIALVNLIIIIMANDNGHKIAIPLLSLMIMSLIPIILRIVSNFIKSREELN